MKLMNQYLILLKKIKSTKDIDEQDKVLDRLDEIWYNMNITERESVSLFLSESKCENKYHDQ